MYFDQSVRLLGKSFPNTWNTVTSHQFGAWSQYERCLPHTNFLIQLNQKHKLQCINLKAFAELILRCSWYISLHNTPEPWVDTQQVSI